MGDDWDDEDFEVPTFEVKKSATAAAPMWDDEEQEEQEELPAPPSAAQVAAAQKKKEQEAITMANKMKFAAEANETAEEKKLREKRQAEEADIAASADLFGAAASGPVRATSGVANLSISRSTSGADLPLKNIRDYQQYATGISTKFTASNSTPFNVGAFYTKLTNEIKGKLPAETLQDAIEALQNELENKKASVKKVPPKKSKQQLKVELKKHEDTFGGDDYDDKYSHYSNIEDDFM